MSLHNRIISLNQNVTKHKSTQSSKESKESSNKLIDYQYSSIIFANDTYKKKMDKSQKTCNPYTFTSKKDFDSYINNNIQWTDIPVSTKYKLIDDFIQNDDSIPIEKKFDIQLKINDIINSKDIVSYDKDRCVITNIKYY